MRIRHYYEIRARAEAANDAKLARKLGRALTVCRLLIDTNIAEV